MARLGDTDHMKFMKRKDSMQLPSYFSEHTVGLDELQGILAHPPGSRTTEQLDLLVTFSKNIKFFAELRNTISPALHQQCCNHLVYSFSPTGSVSVTQVVFKEGDSASHFYLILAGTCAVLKQTGKGKARMATILRQGDCFGELALISNRPRAATVMCREDCHFAVLGKEQYTDILGKVQKELLADKVRLIRLHPFFKKWGKDAILHLSYYFKQRGLKANQPLFLQGQATNEVFLLLRGEFSLTKNVFSSTVERGRKKQVRKVLQMGTVSEGEFLGLIEALEGNAFECACSCVSDEAEVLVITAQNLKETVAGDSPELVKMEREKARDREERARARAEVKETRENVPYISEEMYQRLQKKPSPPPVPAPIIYEPRRLLGHSRVQTPWRLHPSMIQVTSPSPDCTLPDILQSQPLSSSMHVEKHSNVKWEDRVFRPRKPKLITDGCDLYHYRSLPVLKLRGRRPC